VAGFTCVWTVEGWLHVSAVIALFFRCVVGEGGDDGATHLGVEGNPKLWLGLKTMFPKWTPD